MYYLERITFDREVDLKEIVQYAQKIVPSKTYNSQDRIYLDQRRVDIMTQFNAEFQLIQAKIPSVDLTIIKQADECKND